MKKLKTVTVDFATMPDGASASAGNPYAGVLYLEAMAGYRWLTGSVSGGALAVQPVATPDPGEFQSLLIGIFILPVTHVALVAKCYRNASCSYIGVDSHGVALHSNCIVIPGSIDGNPPSTGWVTVPLTIPVGGHLVSFAISDRDPKPGDAAFFLKSISFSV